MPRAWVTADDYLSVQIGVGQPMASKTGRCLEHRLVMSQIIGRPLLSTESVHHRNGDRQDNRPENLELWSSPQKPGQRARDLLAYARYLIELYEPIEALLP